MSHRCQGIFPCGKKCLSKETRATFFMATSNGPLVTHHGRVRYEDRPRPAMKVYLCDKHIDRKALELTNQILKENQ